MAQKIYDDDENDPTFEELLDDKSFDSAAIALEAWLALPKHRRSNFDDTASCALLDCSFGLLATPAYKNLLAQKGLEWAIERDDVLALQTFIGLGAVIPRAEASQDQYSKYYETWRSSTAHQCATKGAYNCLDFLIDHGTVAADKALSDPMLAEPEPSPLRQVDAAMLNQLDANQRAAAGISEDHGNTDIHELFDTSRDFILALLRHHSESSESLSLSIASSEVARSNPLFVVLGKNIRNSRRSTPDSEQKLVQRLANESKLLTSSRASHRSALLRLCADGSELACSLAIEHAIEPDSTDSKDQQRIFDTIARHGGLIKIPASLGSLVALWSRTEQFSADYFAHIVRSGCEPIETELASAEAKASSFDHSKLRECQFGARRLRDYLADYKDGKAHGIAFPDSNTIKKAIERIEAILLNAELPPHQNEPRTLLAECAQLLAKHVYENKPTQRI